MTQKIAIIGLGLMGGSLAAAIKKFLPSSLVYGLDRAEITEKAVHLHYIDQPIQELSQIPVDINMIFLAAPIAENRNLLQKLSELQHWQGVLISDLSSTKASIVHQAETLSNTGWYFVGGHPMTGSEKRGLEAATPYLFQNAVYVICPTQTRQPPPEVMSGLINLLYKIGARIISISPDLHDKIVAHVSHLPNLVAISLLNCFEKEEKRELFLQLAAGGFKDLTRIAQSHPSVWIDIFQDNQLKIHHAIDQLIDYLKGLQQSLSSDALLPMIQKAHQTRLNLPASTKGFINPLVDIRLELEDKPGVLADVCYTCANENINIKDVAIVKVREQVGGVLQLSFEGKTAADKAIQALKKKGYTVHE